MDAKYQNVLNSLNEAEKAAGVGGGGGGGLFCKANIDFGFKVMAHTTDHDATFFPVKYFPIDEKNEAHIASMKEAFAAAKLAKASFGIDSNPAMSFCLTVKPEDVYGKTVKWTFVMHRIVAHWTRNKFNGFEEEVIPALVDLNILKAGTYFLKVKYVLDKGNPGEEGKPNLLWIPAQVFANESECRAAAELFYSENAPSSVVEGGADLPAGWDDATWKQYKPEIDKILGGTGPKPKRAEKVAKDYGLPVEWVTAYAAKL